MRPLGPLEAQIMEQAWEASRPLSVRDMLERLSPARARAYTTVMTVMDKLHDKGWLKRERVGRAFVYRPALPRADYAAALMREALDLGRDSRATLVRFAEQMPPEQAAVLRAALSRENQAP